MNPEKWEEGSEECEQTAWSSGCSSHTDSEKAAWWLLWSTTPRANTQDSYDTGDVCVCPTCVCLCARGAHRFRAVVKKKCCAVKMTVTVSAYAALTRDSGDDKQLLFTFSPHRWIKGWLFSQPPPQDEWDQCQEGRGLWMSPCHQKKSHLKWKERSKSLSWGAEDGFSGLQ